MNRAVIFIDNAHFKRVLDRYKIQVDYLAFSEKVIGARDERLRTYVYDCPPFQSDLPTDEEKARKSAFDRFEHRIRHLPRFEFRKGRLQLLRDAQGQPVSNRKGTAIFRQKGVDMALGIDVCRLAVTHQINTMVLVAGDADFVPAVEAARNEGVLVKLCHGSEVHDSLLTACDERFLITQEFLSECALQPR